MGGTGTEEGARRMGRGGMTWGWDGDGGTRQRGRWEGGEHGRVMDEHEGASTVGGMAVASRRSREHRTTHQLIDFELLT